MVQVSLRLRVAQWALARVVVADRHTSRAGITVTSHPAPMRTSVTVIGGCISGCIGGCIGGSTGGSSVGVLGGASVGASVAKHDVVLLASVTKPSKQSHVC
jgi:hypothetical protein